MQNKKLLAGLVDVSFVSDNLGLRALGYGLVTLFLKRYPQAQFICFNGISKNEPAKIEINGQGVALTSFFYHTGLKFLLPNNILHLYLRSLIYKWFHLKLFTENSLLGSLKKCDVVLDITGGDGFTEMYGPKRFRATCMLKAIVINLGIPLILAPQTYGPFKSEASKKIVRTLVSSARKIFARDRLSLDYLKNELKIQKEIKVFPDVSFILPRKDINWPGPQDFIGLNISGLLYIGGLNRKNDYGLLCDYQTLMKRIISFFLLERKENVVLIPHVVSRKGFETDRPVIERIIKEWNHPKLCAVEQDFDAQQVRSILKNAKFFIGSRMHACISAVCEFRPTVCLAYSRKFRGVMGVIGYDKFVLDLASYNTDEALEKIKSLYDNNKEEMTNILRESIPRAQQELETLFDEI